MKCTEFERQLRDCVERRCRLTLAMERHIAECADCDAAWQDHRFLDQAIVEWIAETPAVCLSGGCWESNATVDMVHGPLPDGQRRPAWHGRLAEWRMLQVLALAAGVLLMTVPLIHSPPQKHRGSDRLISSPAAAVRGTHRATASLDSLLRDASDAYLVLARDALSPVSEIVPPRVVADDAGKGSAAETLQGDADNPQWQRGIEPIQRDFEQAVGFLVNVVTATPPKPL